MEKDEEGEQTKGGHVDEMMEKDKTIANAWISKNKAQKMEGQKEVWNTMRAFMMSVLEAKVKSIYIYLQWVW